MSAVTYRSEVDFLELSDPPLIEQTGDEGTGPCCIPCSRHARTTYVGLAVSSAAGKAEGRDQYTARSEGSHGPGRAPLCRLPASQQSALLVCAKAVASAKHHFENGN